MFARSLLSLAARVGQQQGARNFNSVAGSAGNLGRRAALLLPSAGLGFYAVVADEPRRVAYTLSVLPVRLGRDMATAIAIFSDYKWSLRGLEGSALHTARSACHQRGADRLLHLCFANGGIYIKLGQHIAMLDHLLPSEYVLTMRNNMLDRCPVSSWESVRRTLEEDLGPLELLFSEIEHEPIASASLAQVHIAKDLNTGKKLAIKVQHRGLRETSAVDLAAIEMLVKAIKFLSPSVDYMWLVHEANDNLPRELDFRIEAENSERCAANLSRSRRVRGRVWVPTIDHSRSSQRVLTMEFIDGVKISDAAGLKSLGCRPAALARLISTTFNEMIFTFGDVHADPHAANMLVRATPPGDHYGPQKWQLVLLDHGLYRQLDDDFRLQYASLWRSLIFADVNGITASATAMNAGHAVPLFAGMLTQRPWKEVSHKGRGTERLNLKYTEQEREQILEFTGRFATEIGELLARIPRELLLLLKTNDCLRAVDAELRAGVNNYVIVARECSRALAEHRVATWPGLATRTYSAVEAIKLEARLAVLRAVALLEPLRRLLLGIGSFDTKNETA